MQQMLPKKTGQPYKQEKCKAILVCLPKSHVQARGIRGLKHTKDFFKIFIWLEDPSSILLYIMVSKDFVTIIYSANPNANIDQQTSIENFNCCWRKNNANYFCSHMFTVAL